MNTLISVIGPTATGKTAFALQLADQFRQQFSFIDIISADSRQVYKGMEIGTGVDMPPEFALTGFDSPLFPFPYFQSENIRIHGVSLLQPTEEWSVTHFRELARKVVESSWGKGGLPILVGGTGLYNKHFFNEDKQLRVKPNEEVRAKAETMNVTELQAWLLQVQPTKLDMMNDSDRQNPRRLVRAIEIAVAGAAAVTTESSSGTEKSGPLYSVLSPTYQSITPFFPQITIGLTDTLNNIQERIKERVHARLAHGMIEETENLMEKYDVEEWRLPAFSATGYKEVRAYLEDVLPREKMVELWVRREVQYAKRQLTWWKKYGQGSWYMVCEAGWMEGANEEVREFISKP